MYFDISRSQEAVDRLHELEIQRDELRAAIEESDGDTEEYELQLEDVLDQIDEMLEIVEEHNRIFREEDNRGYYKLIGFDEVWGSFYKLVEGF